MRITLMFDFSLLICVLCCLLCMSKISTRSVVGADHVFLIMCRCFSECIDTSRVVHVSVSVQLYTHHVFLIMCRCFSGCIDTSSVFHVSVSVQLYTGFVHLSCAMHCLPLGLAFVCLCDLLVCLWCVWLFSLHPCILHHCGHIVASSHRSVCERHAKMDTISVTICVISGCFLLYALYPTCG